MVGATGVFPEAIPAEFGGILSFGEATLAGIASFRDLIVWQKSMTLADEAFSVARLLPRSEQHGLAFQIRRAAASIPANIAEGHARHGRQAYANYVGIALGSLAELETHLEIAVRTGMVAQGRVAPALSLSSEVGRMLGALTRALRKPPGERRDPPPPGEP